MKLFKCPHCGDEADGLNFESTHSRSGVYKIEEGEGTADYIDNDLGYEEPVCRFFCSECDEEIIDPDACIIESKDE